LRLTRRIPGDAGASRDGNGAAGEK